MLIQDDYDARAKLAIESLKEHAIFGRISQVECDATCETIEFLRLHAGALEVHVAHLRDWVRCGEGMAVVPIKPTGRMLMAGHRNGGDSVSCGQIWEGMVNARPENAHEPI